jgi:hypothetical protein
MDKFSTQDIRRFSFGIRVRGAYVQQPEKSQLVGIEDDIALFSIDASSLYPNIMILNNISEETLQARVYDWNIVNKLLDLMQQLKTNPISREEVKEIIYPALHSQFEAFVKREKPAKQKEVLKFNSNYYTELFCKMIDSSYTFEQICKPIDDESYFLLKSCLHPLLEAISWTSIFNLKYNNTVVDYVFYPDKFERMYSNKTIYIMDNIYSSKTQLLALTKEELVDRYFKKYLLNPHGVLFNKHKDKLARDIAFLKDTLDSRSIIKNIMIVFSQLQENINHGNEAALELAEKLSTGKIDEITPDLVERSDLLRVMSEKKIKDVSQLAFDSIGDIKQSLNFVIFTNNLKQLAAKVFANSGFGIKGLSSFPFSSPLLGNAITTAGKIYGIKVCQAAAAQTIVQEGKGLTSNL